ncbi:MAG: hypothetical protein QXU50_01910 [Candidatus Korarchaeum sp.]
MSEVAFLTEVGFEWVSKEKIFNLRGVRFKIFTLGCEDRCVSLIELESLIQPKAGEITLCGSDLLDIGIGIGRKRVLMVHRPCEVRTGDTVLRIPEAPSSLPNVLRVMKVTYTLQELGRGARIKVLYSGDPRVYVLVTPSEAILDSRGRCVNIPPEPVLLATPSGSELRFGDVRLKLP